MYVTYQNARASNIELIIYPVFIIEKRLFIFERILSGYDHIFL